MTKLHVIHPKKSSNALIIRRGPSDVVGFFGLNLKDDTVIEGQWLKGRIYENQCDLSPDGSHIIYLASKGKRTKDTKGSWTAVSKYPYMTAIDLLDSGTTYGGGGMFLSDNRGYELDIPYNTCSIKKQSQYKVDAVSMFDNEFWKSGNSIYFRRLIRDGWVKNGNLNEFYKIENSKSKLKKVIYLNNCKIQEEVNQLVDIETEMVIKETNGQWMELLGNYLYWSSKGCIYKAKLKSKELAMDELICDLNEFKYKEIISPYKTMP